MLLYGEWVEEHVLAPVAHRQYVFTVPRLLRTREGLPQRGARSGFRRAVLDFPVGERAVSEELRSRMLGWRYSGFSVHNQVCVAAEDAEGRKKLAGTMLRAPLSLAKMTYDTASGTVIYRSKMHLGLKRNFQVMAGAQWLELLCKHIPDRYEQLVR